VQEIQEFRNPALWSALHREQQWQPQPARALENLRQGLHSGRVGSVDGFESEDSVPCSLGGEAVTCFNEQCLQGWGRQVAQEPLAKP
jgi:hypothetical protein